MKSWLRFSAVTMIAIGLALLFTAYVEHRIAQAQMLPPQIIQGMDGEPFGPLQGETVGPNGCAFGQTIRCVHIVPVAVRGNEIPTFEIAFFAAFWIDECRAPNDLHRVCGWLLPNYILDKGQTEPTWTYGSQNRGNVLVVKLINPPS